MSGNTPQSIFEKLWNSHHILTDEGESLMYVDVALAQENTLHAFTALEKSGREVLRPQQIYAFTDHYVPTTGRAKGVDGIPDTGIRNMVIDLQAMARKYGVTLFGMDHEHQGIMHIVPPEQGIIQPGLMVIGNDSHTSTHGAFGSLAYGVGASEFAHVMATQGLWQRKPKSMRITIDGTLGFGVSAKDVILALIAHIGVDGAQGYAMEYAGSTIAALSMEGRMTICNMSIEAGGRVGLIAPDDKTYAYVEGRPYAPKGKAWQQALDGWHALASDAGATFDKQVKLDAAQITPTATWGVNPAQALPVTGVVPDPAGVKDAQLRSEYETALEYMALKPGTALQDIKLDRVFIGSCTNGRIEDLRAAADVAKRGNAVVPTWVVPGSMSVKRQAEKEGLDQVFIKAGFEWRDPGCSMCTAINGDHLQPGERCASTSNRNFRNRQGPGGRTHLVSPAMAAAAALKGRLTDVRELLK
ncbi:MAG: 3-isopropylmalate dehydratase large subunit [Betaproteobacteria bacterium]|nr:3-isopropylmalate dehydratase large subunit [Betaproteobacteria bacterium]MDH4294502.1 3-isopropylmalate dehydratase large subunit [Betaproteobacteria bacterium]MDH5343548.1 3-isopropylmalate dehydratase large subunit [Betaproteobacteria bacterium]